MNNHRLYRKSKSKRGLPIPVRKSDLKIRNRVDEILSMRGSGIKSFLPK